MRALLLTGVLAFSLLATAGSGLALIEAVGMVGGFVQESTDNALAFPPAAQEMAEEAASDPAGFAEQTVATADQAAASFLQTVEAIAALELGALSGATEMPANCAAYPEACADPAFWQAYAAYYFEA